MPSQDVRPSVTRRNYVETVKRITKLFYHRVANHSSFFRHQTLWQYSDGDPLTRVSTIERRVYEKIAMFDLTLSRKWYKTGPWLPRKANRNWYAIYRIVLFPMSLSDLQWISEIFNDTKQGAASLRQLSFLYCTVQDASDELCTDSRVSSQVHNVQFRLAQFRHRYRQLHDDWVVSRRHSGQGTVHHFQTSTSAGGDSRRAIRPRIHVRYYATATTAMLRLALATGDGW